MNILSKFRAPSRVRTRVTNNTTPIIFAAKVQVKIGAWITIWSETCDLSDCDTLIYIINRANALAHEFKPVES